MPKITKLIDEKLSKQASRELTQLGDIGIVAIRLRAIIAAFKHGLKTVSEVYDINRSSLHRWVALYRSGGLEALGNIKKPSRSKLNTEQQATIRSWIDSDSSLTIKAIVIMIEEKFDIKISKSSVHRLLIKLGFSHITGRAEHYKSDKSAQAEFKKNLQEKVRNNPNTELYFFDESRFGTHSKQGFGWFKKGSRTAVKTKLGYKSFYLYSATNHSQGKEFTLILPYVNKACMQLYLNELSRSIVGRIMLVMDQAGWHKGLEVPNNIEIIFLPPYSPELNPVERYWLHIKNNVLKNKIYKTLDELEQSIITFLRTINENEIKSICNCSYV